MRPYPFVRVGRAASVCLLANNFYGADTSDIAAIAFSETMSVVSDYIGILPLFGNVFQLFLLAPSLIHIYLNMYLFIMEERHTKELTYLVLSSVLLLMKISFYG